MKRKTLSLVLAILVIFALFTACEGEQKQEDKKAQESQIKLIAQNTDTWKIFDLYPGEHFKYAVTDLDDNGRLEVITTVCRGTGCYSESKYYEVSEDFDSLISWEHKTDDFKNHLQADIISGKFLCYINPDTNERYYYAGDSWKEGGANNGNFKICMTFKDETVTDELLVYWTLSASTKDEAGNYEVTETIKTRDGVPLTREEFKSFADKYFEGFEKYDVAINWQSLRTDDETLATDLPKAELEALLTQSFEGFSITKAKTLEELSETESQIKVIAENSSMWLSRYYGKSYTGREAEFCVADLDGNGRLEVISADVSGSGIYTTSYWAEVSSGFDGLYSIKKDFGKNSEPDILTDSTDCFINPETGERFYSFADTIRVSGYYSTHTEGVLSIKDNAVSFTQLAVCTSVAENPDDISVRTYTYADAEGNTLTKEEFNSYIETYLEGSEKHSLTLKWQKLDKENVPSKDELEALLTQSYEGFSVK